MSVHIGYQILALLPELPKWFLDSDCELGQMLPDRLCTDFMNFHFRHLAAPLLSSFPSTFHHPCAPCSCPSPCFTVNSSLVSFSASCLLLSTRAHSDCNISVSIASSTAPTSNQPRMPIHASSTTSIFTQLFSHRVNLAVQLENSLLLLPTETSRLNSLVHWFFLFHCVHQLSYHVSTIFCVLLHLTPSLH